MAAVSSSQPAKAVWIEITKMYGMGKPKDSHSLRRLCGLKYPICDMMTGEIKSQPAKAVWIEILGQEVVRWDFGVTACEGCVD